MAKKVTVDLVDDLDPTLPAATTVQFGYDGADYEIDLSEHNAAAFAVVLRKYIENGRRLTSARRGVRRSGGQPGQSGLPLREIRDWAQANGHKVSSRGRVSAEIVRLFNAAKDAPEAVVDQEPEKQKPKGMTSKVEAALAQARTKVDAPEFSEATA